MKKEKIKDLFVIPTLNFGEDWLTNEQIVSDILEQNKAAGYEKFIIWYPSTGIFSDKFPSLEEFKEAAVRFREIKEEVAKSGIKLGWWLRTSINSGPGEEFERIVKFDGTKPHYSNCPLGKQLQNRLSEAIAVFAKTGKPDLIFMEDDYSVVASAGNLGCFCEHHLKGFAEKIGKRYTREELVIALTDGTTESLELLKAWREYSTDTLVELGEAIRKEVDKKTPEIPIYHMQPGNCDCDGGDSIYRVSKAFAGDKHTPASRIASSLYECKCEKDLPLSLFNAQYRVENIKEEFTFVHETDPFPHTKFWTSGNFMKTVMGAVYSMGYDGSTFNNAQFSDDQNEERTYDRMFAKESTRMNEVHKIAKQCALKGVGVEYDPFYNVLDCWERRVPLWVQCLSKYCIPIITAQSDVLFWDLTQAKYKSDFEIKKALSKGLFLDGEAAKCLCERGYGEYLGVNIVESLCEEAYFKTGNPNAEPISFDIGAREVIRDEFVPDGKGKNMTSPFMYSPRGYGNIMKMDIMDEKCEILTDFYDYKKNYITPSMTRFENSLGGRVVVMGITLFGNNSHSLVNYRRQRLFNDLITWCGGEIVFAKEEADVYTIMNEAVNPEESGFIGMITLSNLCSDNLEQISLYLPQKWRNAEFYTLEPNGEWRKADCESNGEMLIVKEKLDFLNPLYLLAK